MHRGKMLCPAVCAAEQAAAASRLVPVWTHAFLYQCTLIDNMPKHMPRLL